MAIPEGVKKNFETLQRAFEYGDVCVAECEDKKTGEKVPVICAVERDEDEIVTMIPFAKMFMGSPYDELWSPIEVDERNA